MGVLTGPARGVLQPQVCSTSTAELHERGFCTPTGGIQSE